MDSRWFRPLGARRVLEGTLFVGALGSGVLAAIDARADMCLSSGNPDNDTPKPDAGDAAVSMHRKRNVGGGLLASASIATVWLTLRRSSDKKKG